MRIRRLSAFFWATCIIAFLFILYIVTDLSFKLPSIKPALVEPDDNKWSSFESKLRNIENGLNLHHSVVEEIKKSMDQIVEQSQEVHPPLRRPKPVFKEKPREFKVVGDEPPRMHKKINMSYCPILKTSKTDVQMLSMYDRIMFDDIDGGVWKQGWNIEYKENQWSSKHKLRVFIVPHSHNDPGWIKTFENYYKTQTRAIFTNMVEKLKEGVGRKFIWAETSYLALWWTSDATSKEKEAFKSLLNSGQIEIVTGGWVMNDEANSHWLSVAQQLTTGHQWLIENLGYTPKNGWAIDPFGHSSGQPYLLKLTGLDNSVIQRVHYRVKKELGLHRQLEFKWRQVWDGVGKTDMFTHMMPFYSYDVPHSCGPDPKICCQFDFKRLPGNGITCPWGLPPRKIIVKNVNERASMILDQWRKKAQLYRSNVVMFPLGDDFRYDRANEWDNQYQNYEMIIDYINNKDEWNTEVQFGTLQDYFKAVHEEVKLTNFPVLSGDFFTYADRNQHYWSGYYTSRPFYKNMDRVLLAYVRAAEIITSQACSSHAVSYITSLQLRDRVEQARRSLALFQHHDGVTGTSRDEVREDYAKKMLDAIKHSQAVIQQAAYHLLKQPFIQDRVQDDVYFDVDDIWRRHDEIPSRITIALDMMSPSRRLLLYNALPFKRTQVLTVFVSTPHVEVYDPEGNPIMAQISPVVTGEKRLGFAANKFHLSFPATVNALAVTVYTVSLRDNMSINKYTSYARVRVYNADFWNVDLPKMFAVEQPAARLTDDVTVQAGKSCRVIATMNGLLKAIVSPDGKTTPVHMDFVQYDTQKGQDNNSGAYLFIPNGPAAPFKATAFPEIVITEGPFKATLYSGLIGPSKAEIVLAMTVYYNPSLPQSEVEISNTFLIDPSVDDLELAMRFSTVIKNGDVFYTDINGMQMIKRRHFEKIPLQANFYPLPAAAYIEDENSRLTLLTSTPLGMAALQSGQIEIMQDRRLSRDDNRGLSQGVLDNVRTRHTFKLIVEQANNPCTPKSQEQASGQLTLGAHVSQQLLLQPIITMHYTANENYPRPAYSRSLFSAADIVLASYHSHITAKNKDGTSSLGMGMTLQRVHLDTCYGNRAVAQSYPPGDGQIPLTDLVDVPPDGVFDSSLTFVTIGSPVPEALVTLCPMEIRSVFINQTIKRN
ncbi:alpha-mannosidase 2 [Pararge aegeria]|uniref:Alpha-mannosidase n=1 Tax=Pararge aegeria aegeria TaxID=348720 RepID=A0A8S4S407_9NEOP|nr:alpha-mannosidase 2 [Pararge aegeria]CAH2250872.1 jg10238 [Pararge aegeria aegeria]